MLKVKIVNKSQWPDPFYATEASAGMDLRADLKEPLTLGPLERALVPTGIFIELPVGYEAQVRPRSGLATKKGITVINSPGTVDADFRGELRRAGQEGQVSRPVPPPWRRWRRGGLDLHGPCRADPGQPH